VLGPLPTLYRVVVTLAALLVFAAGGAWAAFVIPYPLLITVGASIGLAVGAVCAYLLVHPSAHPGDARRHRLH
jgi:Na+/H+ antiporter NhaC